MLVFILLLSFVALFALLWGGSLLAQGYLYNLPANRLDARAALAAALMALFITAWVAIDRRAPGKYGTLLEFTPYTTTVFDEFEAVRWEADPATAHTTAPQFRKTPEGKPVETLVKVRRRDGNRNAPFVTPDNKEFQLQSGQYMTAALLVKLSENAEPVRFDAVLKTDTTGATVYATTDRQFNEARGSRYIYGTQLGLIYVPHSGAIFLALVINALNFLLWFVAFWLILQFTFGHALFLAFAFGLAHMVVIMPMLFEIHRS